jgi:hypothetical protein
MKKRRSEGVPVSPRIRQQDHKIVPEGNDILSSRC